MGQNVGDCRRCSDGPRETPSLLELDRRRRLPDKYGEEIVSGAATVNKLLSTMGCSSYKRSDKSGNFEPQSIAPERHPSIISSSSAGGSGEHCALKAKYEDERLKELRAFSTRGLKCGEKEVAAVTLLCQDPYVDVNVRLQAIQTFKHIVRRGDAGACGAIMECLQDELREIRVAALYAHGDIADMQTDDGISVAIAALEDVDEDTRNAAKQALTILVGEGTCRIATCYEAAARTGHQDPQTRLVALRVLSVVARMTDRRAVIAVLDLLSDPDSSVRAESLHVLSVVSGAGEASAVKFVIDSCAADVLNDDVNIRLASLMDLSLLGQKSGEIGSNAVIRCLADREEGIRTEALRILPTVIQTGDAKIVSGIIEHLRHREDSVRVNALHALSAAGKRGDSDALTAVWPRTKDCDPNVRIAALRAVATIANYGDEKVITGMAACLKDPWSELRNEALSVLGKVASSSGCESAISSAISCLEDKDAGVRFTAVQLLSKLAGESQSPGCKEPQEKCQRPVSDEAVEKLASLASHEDAGIRSVVVRALGIVAARGDRCALETTRRLTIDKVPDVRIESLNSLSVLAERGDEESVKSAISCLGDSLFYVRYEALNTLGEVASCGDERAIRKVAELLEDGDADVRISAGKILSKISQKSDPLVISVVAARLQHYDVQVRLSSLNTLLLVTSQGNTTALIAVQARLEDSVADVRAEALRCLDMILGEIENDGAINATCARLADINLSVRLTALQVLDPVVEKGNQVAIKAVSERLNNEAEDVSVRRAAVLALTNAAKDLD